jgi:RNA polymerase sigma-70 factor (ECF subfamily)
MEMVVVDRHQQVGHDTVLDFVRVYQDHFYDVARWVRAMGVNSAEIQDVTQDVFVIVQRKLSGFDGNNLRGFLYRIAQRKVRDYRRRAMIRNFFRWKGPEQAVEEVPDGNRSADMVLQHKLQLGEAGVILSQMNPIHRRAFVLFEIEGYSGEEIAELEGVPLATIWTRLHNARRKFLEQIDDEEDPND